MSGGEGSDSDVPEEFTAEQGVEQYQEIRKAQKESEARAAREGKERRRKWAQRKTSEDSKDAESVEDALETDKKRRKKTPKSSRKDKCVSNVVEDDTRRESKANVGMLPSNIVELLAAREKRVFSSESEDDEITEAKSTRRKKKTKNSGVETIILNEKPPAQCLQSSIDFLKKRKMQVSRSSSVLNNANQALRLLSGMLKQN